jgi:hypothetical protein
MARAATVVFTLIVGAALASCGGGGSGGGSGDSAVAVQTTSVACLKTQTSAGFDLGNVVASGTASGPPGSRFTFDISNGGQSAVTIGCGAWTASGNLANNVTCTATAAASSITWTVTQQVFWCTSGCNSSPATNNSDLTSKYTTAFIVDAANANQHSSAVTVTCGP